MGASTKAKILNVTITSGFGWPKVMRNWSHIAGVKLTKKGKNNVDKDLPLFDTAGFVAGKRERERERERERGRERKVLGRSAP